MSKTTKIVLAILGGALVGGIGVCGIIWPQYVVLTISAQGLITLAVGIITGVQIEE